MIYLLSQKIILGHPVLLLYNLYFIIIVINAKVVIPNIV